jgi:hypothetical protein
MKSSACCLKPLARDQTLFKWITPLCVHFYQQGGRGGCLYSPAALCGAGLPATSVLGALTYPGRCPGRPPALLRPMLQVERPK